MRLVLCGFLAFSLALGCSDAAESGSGASADGKANGVGDGVVFGGGDGVQPGTDVYTGDGSGHPPGPCDFPLAPAPGEEGAPCNAQDDCDSGFCVEGADGRICTRKCVDCCPHGFSCQEWKQGDAEFVCMPRLAALCRPCINDSECAAINKGALCVSYGADTSAGAFCGGACAETKECPAGYVCESAKGSQGAGKQCVRKTGQCGCSPRSITDGAATTCALTNNLGTCGGLRKCTSPQLGACDAPAAAIEQCNNADDDCDGETDEDIQGTDCKVTNGFGTCPGVTKCSEGKEFCQGLTPQKEICNGQDDDCDGTTDEGFPDSDKDGKADCLDDDQDGDNYPDAKDCDPKDPKINPGATEVCNNKDDDCDGLTDEPDAKGCKKWYADVDADKFGDPAKSACLCAPDAIYKVPAGGDCNDLSKKIYPGATETCNGADDNCDSATDEGFSLGGQCEDGLGKCKSFGKVICSADGASTACSAKATGSGKETCDGFDDDCDGKTDEDFGLGGACTAGKGECKTNGTLKCAVGGASATCSAAVPQGKTEVCDGLDNDCDGKTDEGCDDDGDGYCDINMTFVNNKSCAKGKGDCNDARKDVYPGHTELCDGRDNDCNGTKDNFTKDCSNGCGKGSRTCTSGNWSSCTAPTPKCTSGACCDGCNYRGSTTKCGTKPTTTTYKCSGSCGGQIKRYESWQYCTGSSASCGSSNIKQVYKGVTKTCSAGQLCSQSGSSATCKTCSSGCVSGKCNSQPKYTVCIDPQFGGSAVGATWNGVSTKTLNLDIALKLRTLLDQDTANGKGGGTWKAVLTRSKDVNLSIASRIATCNNANAHRVISIAVNAYSVKSARGLETYYNKSAGKAFCTTLHNEIRNRTGLYNRGVKYSGAYTIIKGVKASHACMPAPGFISNSGDVAKLKTSAFRWDIARAMLHALQKNYGYAAFNP
ncbi:MAG: N-acetylmuramoyl-L-alanine amidase [Myxococcales bacterium]|nr:N-acetylmuramoyl-L-alanine amidase [Myxococcales bacterium]